MTTILLNMAFDPRTGEPCPTEWVTVDEVRNSIEYVNVLTPPAIPGTLSDFILRLNLN